MIKTAASGDGLGVELLATSPRDRTEDPARRLTRLFHANIDFVWRAARRFGLSPAEADDAAQHVFLVLSRKLKGIPAGQERSFLFGAAINVARTMVRSKLRKREDFTDGLDRLDEGPNPEESLERARAREAVHRILESMPEDLRAAFVLFELEEMTTSEVAELLGIAPGTVASRVRRARVVFRLAMEALEHHE